MIGQKLLFDEFKKMRTYFPRFIILCGPQGSGKKLFANELCSILKCTSTEIDIKVEDIRNMIEMSYKVMSPIIYIIADADNMSPAAKNALLKVTEDVPNNAYFVMTVQSLDNVLPTIKSRSQIYYMHPYSEKELKQFADERGYDVSKDKKFIFDLCETPGEMELLFTYDVANFHNYVVKVVENIAEVSVANSFKIADKIKFKATDEDNYDIRLFFKAFISICLDYMRNTDNRELLYKYSTAIRITSSALQSLHTVSINRQSVFDSWIISMRENW